MNLLVAKLNCDMNLFVSDVKKAIANIRDALIDLNGVMVGIKGRDWVFAENQLIISDVGVEVVVGRLGRRRRQSMVDLQGDKFVTEKASAWVYANYLLDLETERMLIEERSGYISFRAFARAWAEILMRNRPEVGHIYIGPIANLDNVWKQIKALKKVTQARFIVRPPNFNQEPEWMALAEEIKEINAKEGRHEYTNSEGLNVESSVFKRGIAIASASYGDFSITGSDAQGVKHKITSTSPENIQRIALENIGDDPAVFAADFYKALRRMSYHEPGTR
ncbi:MAG: hypothetical protein HPY71_01540 [Firmicutes bacterium]|nr:hypothetical protein [Bacillota bacterium]